MESDLRRQVTDSRIREMRWRILRVLDAGRPIPVSENLIQVILNDNYFSVGLVELRRELDYLREKDLLMIQDNPIWALKITPLGIDVVEYSVDSPSGILRPVRL